MLALVYLGLLAESKPPSGFGLGSYYIQTRVGVACSLNTINGCCGRILLILEKLEVNFHADQEGDTTNNEAIGRNRSAR